MAERTSTRAGSRRTTPQPAPQTARIGTQSPPRRTTRITRSQSHDFSDSEDGKTSSKARKSAKQAIPDGSNGAAEQSGSKSRKGRSVNHTRTQQGRDIQPTNSSCCPRSPGPVLSTEHIFSEFAKAGSLRGKGLPEICIDQQLTSSRSIYGSRRPQYCLS